VFIPQYNKKSNDKKSNKKSDCNKLLIKPLDAKLLKDVDNLSK